MEIWAVRISQMLRLYLPVVILFLCAWNAIPEASLEQHGSSLTDVELRREMIEIGIGGGGGGGGGGIGIGIGIGGGGSGGGGGGGRGGGGGGGGTNVNPNCFSNPRLYQAFLGLQAWKKAITSDPQGVLNNWVGPDVCNYTGVYCASPPDKSVDKVVGGIDLNHATLTGTMVDEIKLLNDIAIFHINTNNFKGTIPPSISNLRILSELDVSNNQLSGNFPTVVLTLPNLIYLDIRYNKFYGTLPAELFNRNLDAIFVNNNNFDQQIPSNLGNSKASVLSFANNKFKGSIPSSLCNMAENLNEILFLNNMISGCLPDQIGLLNAVTVLDLSFNRIGGKVPSSIGCLNSIEQLNLAYNQLYGEIPDGVCGIKSLQNLTLSNNYFSAEGKSCTVSNCGFLFDDKGNCIPNRPCQRSQQECTAFAAKPKSCTASLPPN